METEYVIVAFIIFASACFFMLEEPSPVISEMTPNSFKISDKHYKFEYKLERNEISLDGILINVVEHSGMRMGGTTVGFHYFNDKSLASYKSTQNTKICNPAFYFSDAKFKFLIPSSEKISDELSSQISKVKSASYSKPVSWRRLKMRGYCVNTPPKFELDGKEISSSSSMFSKCTTMIVTDFKLIDQSVVASN